MARGSILHIARTLPWQMLGGMETHAWALARAWRRRGWSVELLTTSFEDHDVVEEREGVRIHYLRHLPLNRDEVSPWRWWRRFPRRVRDYALAHRIDHHVVHSESLYGHSLFHALLRRQHRAVRLFTVHGTSLQTYRDSSRAELRRRVPAWHPRALGQSLAVRWRARSERRRELPSAHRVVAVSPALVEHLVQDYGVGRDRLDLIPNGIDSPARFSDRAPLRVRLGVPSDCRLLLYLGRLEPSKRVDRLLSHLPSHSRDRLLVAGAGPDESRLRALAGRLPNPAAVRFLGRVDDQAKSQLLAAADVLALPSESEGQPIVILEALAAGTPVYARRPWAPSDLVPLLGTGDDVSAGLDAAVAKTESVRREADRVAREYAWDRIAERYEAAFLRET